VKSLRDYAAANRLRRNKRRRGPPEFLVLFAAKKYRNLLREELFIRRNACNAFPLT